MIDDKIIKTVREINYLLRSASVYGFQKYKPVVNIKNRKIYNVAYVSAGHDNKIYVSYFCNNYSADEELLIFTREFVEFFEKFQTDGLECVKEIYKKGLGVKI